MLGRFGTAALAVIWAGTASAMVCTFETECFEQDGCMESGFGFEIFTSEEGIVQFATEFGDLPVAWSVDEPGVYMGLAVGAGARYFLSTEGEAARLSVHLEGPVAVTYIGRCEGGL